MMRSPRHLIWRMRPDFTREELVNECELWAAGSLAGTRLQDMRFAVMNLIQRIPEEYLHERHEVQPRVHSGVHD